jgi:hypothetical protein
MRASARSARHGARISARPPRSSDVPQRLRIVTTALGLGLCCAFMCLALPGVAASSTNRILLMGGAVGSTPSSAVWSSTDGKTWTALPDMITPRLLHCGSARQSDGAVFVAGGRSSLLTTGETSWVSAVDMLNSTGWTRLIGVHNPDGGGFNNEGCAAVVIGGASAVVSITDT